MLSHTNLFIYYQKIFGMVQHHKYSISDIESLIPYERDIYVSMITNHMNKVREEQIQQENIRKVTERKMF
jgi:hypothetical protein